MNEYFTLIFWQEFLKITYRWIIEALPSLAIILLLVLVALRVSRFFVKKARIIIVHQWKKNSKTDDSEIEKRVDTLAGILQRLIQMVLWSMVFMISMKKIGIDIAPLIAGAGIAGLAIGFGAQELVRDMISGFFLLLENHIRTGDVVSVNGTSGLVENIGLRTITLRDMSGTVHIFQNGKIQSLANLTKEWSAAVFDIAIAYGSDVDLALECHQQVAATMQKDPSFRTKIIAPIEIYGVDQLGDNAIVLKSRIKTKPMSQWEVKREFLFRLKKLFDQHGIEIPFPQRTIHLQSDNPRNITPKV